MFKSISSLILFQNPRPGFQVPNLTLLSITYCSSNFQLCCKLLTTAYVLNFSGLKKKIILFLFVFHWVLLYFFPNKYPDPCQNRPGYSLVEEPITYAVKAEQILSKGVTNFFFREILPFFTCERRGGFFKFLNFLAFLGMNFFLLKNYGFFKFLL